MENLQMPNLESLVSGFNTNPKKNIEEKKNQKPELTDKKELKTPSSSYPDVDFSSLQQNDNLWSFFRRLLEDTGNKDMKSQKAYYLDVDIIETLSQCEFNTSTTHVVNSILRAFLISNLPKLVDYRKERPESLFEKYITTQTS